MDLGMLLAALVVLGLAAEAWSRRAARRGARRTLAHVEALFSGTHEFASVDPARYPWLDLSWYDRARALLEPEGFRFLGDVEDLTLTRQHPRMRTFIRVMSGDRGQVTAGIYQVRMLGMARLLHWGLLPRRIRIVDLGSELPDGRFLVTTNAGRLDTTPVPEAVSAVRMPLSTSLPRLLERHRQRLLDAGVAARRVDSLNEALAAQDRLQLLRNQVMNDREAVVQTIAQQPGLAQAKKRLIDEVRRA